MKLRLKIIKLPKKEKHRKKRELAKKKIKKENPDDELNTETKKKRRGKFDLLEDGELDLSKVKISDLINYGGSIGKPTKAVAEKFAEGRRKNSKNKDPENQNETMEGEEETIETHEAPEETIVPAPVQEVQPAFFAPSLRLENGKFVLNKESLVVTAEDPSRLEPSGEIYESTTHVTSSSFTKRSPNEKWNAKDNLTFNKGLQMFGTDFGMIQKYLLPHKTRRHIKSKFNRDQSKDKDQIYSIINDKIPIDFSLFAQGTVPANFLIQSSPAKIESREPPTPEENVAQDEKKIFENEDENENETENETLKTTDSNNLSLLEKEKEKENSEHEISEHEKETEKRNRN